MESKALTNVKILSKNIIRPFPTSNHVNGIDHPKNYKLSFFDQIALQMHVPCVLFFPLKYSTFTKISTIHEQLEQSLSNLLTHVYPASGRFASDNKSINCHDEGVLYIKAKVESQFCDFLEDAQKDIDLALDFCPKIDGRNSSMPNMPLLAVQVTEFECGTGLALSLSADHLVFDGFTALKFMYEWSKLNKMGIDIHSDVIKCFTFDDFDTIFSPIISEKHRLSKIVKSSKDDSRDHVEMVAKRFLISESVISRLRKTIGMVNFRPSRVELVTAFLWRALINIYQCKNDGRLRPCLLSVPVNLRYKIEFPKYENSFGNFAIEVPVKFIPGETGMELQDIVLLLKDVLQKTNALFAKSNDIHSLASKFHEEIQEWEENEQVDVCMASSLCRFPIYETDFGWGKPCLASFGLRRSDMFWLYDSQCGTGIVVQADLKKDYMDMFGCDNDVLAFISELVD